ncbi:MAG: MSMEG_0565 family glycosyltransferase [Anaerolineales bacterium]
MATQRPLHIALFTYSTKPRGGVVHTLALAEHLAARGHSVHIFALGKDKTGFFRPLAVRHTTIPYVHPPDDMNLDDKILDYIQTYYEHLSRAEAEQFDIYHAQDCVSANALWRLREDGKLPWFIRTIHHIDDFVTPTLIKCQNDSFVRPDHCFTVSGYWQQRLRDEVGVECAVIYNGVDLTRYCPPQNGQREAARQRFGVGDELVFLNIGGIEPRKNTIGILNAFEHVHQRLKQAGRRSVLWLAGGETLLDYTPYRAEFFELLARSPLKTDTDIRLMGIVPDADLPALYHAADVLAFPSVKEGWGLVVLEAQASGLPVLASDTATFREYLRDGENALLVNPLDEAAIADRLLRLVTDEPLRDRLVQGGYPTATAYSWANTAIAHEQHYQRWMREHA